MSSDHNTLCARVEQALAPQPPPTWLVYVPGNGWEEPGTEQQARDVMDHVADELREEAGDGWNEEAESLIMYRAVQVAAFTLTTTAKPGDGTADGERCEASGWDFMARGDVVECGPPDLAALVADLWAALEQTAAERDEARAELERLRAAARRVSDAWDTVASTDEFSADQEHDDAHDALAVALGKEPFHAR